MKKRLVIGSIAIITVLVTAVFASYVVQLTAYVAQFRILVDGEERSFENPIVMINDRTYVPLREVSEVLGMNVEWDEENQKIIINSSQNINEERGTLYRFEQNELWGFTDKNGNVKIDVQFNFASWFVDGIAMVGMYIDDWENYPAGTEILRFGYIDLNGQLITPIKFLRARMFSDGYAKVTLLDGTQTFIDRNGNITGETW